MLYGRDEPRRAGLGGEQVVGVRGTLTWITRSQSRRSSCGRRVYMDKVTGKLLATARHDADGRRPDSSVFNRGGDEGPAAADLRGLPQAVRGRSSSSSPTPVPPSSPGRSTPSAAAGTCEVSCTRPTD